MDQGHLIPITGRDGLHGTLDAPPPSDPNARVEVRLDDGHRVTLPAGLIRPVNGGHAFQMPLGPEDLRTAATTDKAVIPVIREELDVQKRTAERESVVVHVVPKIQTEVVDVPLVEEQVDVERVPVNRFVSSSQPVRQDGDVTVVPVYEEVLVVERRLMLKEEVRVTRRRAVRPQRQRVELRSEDVQVLRSGSEQK